MCSYAEYFGFPALLLIGFVCGVRVMAVRGWCVLIAARVNLTRLLLGGLWPALVQVVNVLFPEINPVNTKLHMFGHLLGIAPAVLIFISPGVDNACIEPWLMYTVAGLLLAQQMYMPMGAVTFAGPSRKRLQVYFPSGLYFGFYTPKTKTSVGVLMQFEVDQFLVDMERVHQAAPATPACLCSRSFVDLPDDGGYTLLEDDAAQRDPRSPTGGLDTTTASTPVASYREDGKPVHAAGPSGDGDGIMLSGAGAATPSWQAGGGAGGDTGAAAASGASASAYMYSSGGGAPSNAYSTATNFDYGYSSGGAGGGSSSVYYQAPGDDTNARGSSTASTYGQPSYGQPSYTSYGQ